MRTWPRGDRWTWLEHPLVGRHRLASAVGLGYVVVTVVATAVAVALYAGLVDLIPGWPVRIVDGFTAVVIMAALVSATVAPTAYAAVNRGPVMAAAVGLVPYLSASILTLEYVLTNDLVVALVGASLGATLAIVPGWYQVVRGSAADAPTSADVDGVLVAAGLSVVALAAVWRFDRTAPAEAVGTVDPLHWLVVVPVVLSLACLAVALSQAEVRPVQSASR